MTRFRFIARWWLPALLALDATRGPAAEAIRTARGFEVTRVYSVTREKEGSWISLTADDRGRLYASDQYGPLYRITLSAKSNASPTVAALPLPIGGAHGLAWVDGKLYAVAGQKSVQPTGLYRIVDDNVDGELDRVELLHPLEGDGEHGPHALTVAPDGKSLFVIAGNGTRLPALARSRVPQLWREDSLLAPLPALMGSETRGLLHGGWICRTDLNGREWELVCVGLRNAYAVACDHRGELFTFDSDTEFELNLPWYRPTRVLHAVSGADFGWRRGALKVPAAAPDAWPVVRTMGLGSPTSVLFPSAAKFPPTYQRALWVADWSYGKISALTLETNGASFTAASEEIVSAMPLPITAMCVNPADGALYFVTGGRRTQSALYRLRWVGGSDGSVTEIRDRPNQEITTRQALEAFHGRESQDAVSTAWPNLGSTDAVVRRAARTALESQPTAAWRQRALSEASPRIALAALLALTRADGNRSQADILTVLRKLHEHSLDPELRSEWLRVLALAFGRAEDTPAATRAAWAPLLSSPFPLQRHDLDAMLLELLVYCEAPDAAAKGLAALRSSVTREAQLDFAKSLRVLRTGWTPELRREFFQWLAQTVSWRGGGTFALFLQRIRDDAVAAAPETERAGLRALLTAATKTIPAPDYSATARPFVREWTTDDLVVLAQKDTRKRDPVRGRRSFGAVGCFGCHTFSGEGGALGPDLTGVGQRLALRDLLEAIVEPNREINDQYGTVLIRLHDGRQHAGRIVNITEVGVQLAGNLADPSNVIRIAEKDIAAVEPSKVSLMPGGLLNVLSDEEILDLLAFLRTSR